MSDDVLVSVSARTDVGMHRSGNEDSYLIADLTTGNGLEEASASAVGDRGSLLIVSDGMGGAAAGEIASQMAVTTMLETLADKTPSLDMSEHLRTAAEKANEKIWNMSQENADLTGMGATLTAVLVHGTCAYIAQVGDSRAYLIRSGQIRQLTKDQSLAQMLIDAGAIQPDQMATVPQNVIMQALGTQPNVRAVMTTVQLYRDDCMLLCSDGLSNKIPSDEMQTIIKESESLGVATNKMIELANERGGEDNITVIIAQFNGEALRTISESALYTDHFSTLKKIDVEEDETEITARLPEPTADQEAARAAYTTYLSAQQVPEPAPAPRASEAPAEQPDMVARLPEKRSYAPIILFTVVALLLIAFTAYFAWKIWLQPQPQIIPPQEQQTEPPTPPRQSEPPAGQPGGEQQTPPAQGQPGAEGSTNPQTPAQPAPEGQPPR